MEELFLLLKWAAIPGAGIIASWALDKWKDFAQYDKETRRILSILATGFIGIAATMFLLGIDVLLGIAIWPIEGVEMFKIIADAAAAAIVAGYARHTVLVLMSGKWKTAQE